MPSRSVYLETFGCQMNELDSELVAGRLRALGYAFTDNPDAADVVLYNTCSVRDHAEQKVRSRLGELAIDKRKRPGLVVGVLGCMAERDGVDLIRRMPVVDILCGPGELDKLPTLLDNAVRTKESLLAGSDSNAERGTRNAEHPTSDFRHPTFPKPQALKPSSPQALVSARQIALQGSTARRSATLAAAQDDLELLDLSRSISPGEHDGSAYVRITRGCNKFCTYCVVPHTRGPEVHRPPDHIVDECRRLADAGVIEVTLLGQTVNHYRYEHGAMVMVNGIAQPQKGRTHSAARNERNRRGAESAEQFRTGSEPKTPRPKTQDPRPSLSATTTFADLLARIHDEVPAIQRLRFVTSYPRDFGDDILEVIRDRPRICRYLHVPAQSGSNAMLRAMNRGYEIEEYLDFIDRARAYLDRPERPLMIAGDMIAGFCGETEQDHAASIALLRHIRYKNCFVFKYSPRPGTAAFDRLPDDVPEEIKRRRVNELLDVQHEISDEVSRAQVGTVQRVFVQGISPRARAAAARSAQKPGGVVLTVGGRPSDSDLAEPLTCSAELQDHAPGAAAPVQMTGRTDGDLIVHCDCPMGASPENLVGRLVDVRVTSANALALFGAIETAGGTGRGGREIAVSVPSRSRS